MSVLHLCILLLLYFCVSFLLLFVSYYAGAVLGGVIGGIGGGIVADKVQNCGIDDNFCNRSGLTKKHAYGLPKL